MNPAQLRQSIVDRSEALLGSLTLPPHTTLVATGSLARSEMTPYSDLDLILLHHNGEVPDGVEEIWYPIWDAGMRLDYSVRTPGECAAMIAADSTAALAMLDMRLISGDGELFDEARSLVVSRWRRELNKNFNMVVDTAIARWRRSGSVVAMTRPDLKHGRGGLRDIELLGALALGNLCDRHKLGEQHQLLLDARTQLHVHARRSRDVLDPEFAVDVALDLGYTDRYELAQQLADAARRIDDAVTEGLATARGLLPDRKVFGMRRAVRRPLDVDVVEANGYVVLSRSPDLNDPALPLRVGAVAATTGLPVGAGTWERLQQCPPLPEPWPQVATGDFFRVLSSAEHSAAVIGDMVRHGLWSRYVPEWDRIKGMMPREPSHVSTIDEHSLNTVAGCAAATVTVARPDLLLLGALFHDMGKGLGQPHEQVGAEMVVRAGLRMGLNLRDRACVQTLVAVHTTIPRLIARHDPHSDAAVNELLDAVGYDLLTLTLLEVLTEADAKATGPSVWNSRLASALAILCGRAKEKLVHVRPHRPMVSVTEEIGLEVVDEQPTVSWSGEEIVDVLAVIAAKGWTITEARAIRNGKWQARFAVRATGPEDFDERSFIQAYRSGVYRDLPVVEPANTATFWHGDTLEVRTADRRGALGALIAALPDMEWFSSQTPGATMVLQCGLKPPVDRARVELDVTRALAIG